MGNFPDHAWLLGTASSTATYTPLSDEKVTTYYARWNKKVAQKLSPSLH